MNSVRLAVKKHFMGKSEDKHILSRKIRKCKNALRKKKLATLREPKGNQCGREMRNEAEWHKVKLLKQTLIVSYSVFVNS